MSNIEPRKLSTIQTKENLNHVYAIDNIGPGGANHLYSIYRADDENREHVLSTIRFQTGPRKDDLSIHGVTSADLLEIVRDQLTSFQTGPFSCTYNEKALSAIDEALFWLNARVEDRIARNVLGENKK